MFRGVAIKDSSRGRFADGAGGVERESTTAGTHHETRKRAEVVPLARAAVVRPLQCFSNSRIADG